MKLRAVIFDLDNTLYDYDAAHDTAFGALCAFAGETLSLPETEFRTCRGTFLRRDMRPPFW